ncbi:MAG: hypothetical protein ABJR46_00525 [Tateyamaria sp.]|uniref:hypothetical protein n=1 Tax=Tateyamaria sp. TaxID=1929288 RepID=UPI00328352C4
MTDLIRLLALYYTCDVSAETQFPSPQQWANCMGHYHQIKTHFADDLDGPAAQIEGYARWKIWEKENSELVASLRTRAKAQVSEF